MKNLSPILTEISSVLVLIWLLYAIIKDKWNEALVTGIYLIVLRLQMIEHVIRGLR